jgi:ApaG protein
MSPDFQATTSGITVTVRVFYLADQSKPDDAHFVWAYHVTITNGGPVTVQLLRRTWHITDAHGRTQYVHGEGVIGETPVLEPGENFEYTSGTPLPTPSGFMTGKYHMLAVHEGTEFDIAIPTFSLDCPHQNTRIH